MEIEILIGFGVALVTAMGAFWFKSKKTTLKSIPQKQVIAPKTNEPSLQAAPVVEIKKWTQRLSEGLSRARLDVWGKLAAALGSGDDSSFEAAEEILYTADLPPMLVGDLLEELKRRKGDFNDEASLKTVLAEFLSSRLDPVQKHSLNPLAKSETKPKVIMIVGVNGAGKTTTVGKLAAKLSNEGNKVLVGACDTFRAAAVDQLQVWCDRAGADMVRAKDGADPSGVAYDTVARAVKEGHDFCLVDTAGRLHTATGLMDELAKTKRVMSKVADGFPHEVWLVIDAITGQNALKQAQEFHKALGLTGLVFTKCDGSAKAGSAVGIVQQLQVPITYIGVGESVEDLQPFVVKEYVEALVGLEKSL